MTTPALARLRQVIADFSSVIAGQKSVSALHLATRTDDVPYETGLMFYQNGVLNVMAEFADVVMQVGEELQIPIVNKQGGGTTILNGAPVYVKGAQGNRLAAGLANSADLSTVEILGLATHDIADNQNGRCTFIGQVRDMNTSAYTVGDNIFVDGLGTLTNVKPTAAGTYAAEIGYVAVSHPTQGIIHVHAPRYQSAIAGTTAQRPTGTVRVGQQWYDTTLGKPVWWTGSVWVDATGATV